MTNVKFLKNFPELFPLPGTQKLLVFLFWMSIAFKHLSDHNEKSNFLKYLYYL